MKIAITASPGPPRPAPLLLYSDIAAAFRVAAGLGCQGVEIQMRSADEMDRRAVKRLCGDYGLAVPTVGTGPAAADGLIFSDPDARVRALTLERVRGHIEFAAEVGSAVTIGSLCGKLGPTQGEVRRERRGRALECLAETCRLAALDGVTVLLEPLNRYESDYVNTLADGISIATEIGACNIRLLADTFHMNIEEADLAASIRAAGQSLGHVHLADTNRQAPGHGHLDVAGVLRALEGIGYQGFLSFEVFPLPDALAAIRDGIQAVHSAKGTVVH